MQKKYTLLGSGLLILAFLVWMVPASMPAGVVMLLLQYFHVQDQKYWIYLTLGLSELLLIAPLFVYMAVTKTSVRALMGNRTNPWQLILAGLIGVFLAPAIQGISEIFFRLFELIGVKSPDTGAMNPNSIGTMFAGMAAIGLTAGIVEEPIFRGVALRGLGSVTGRRAAVWVSALAFSLIHLDIVGTPIRLLIGALLGYMAWRSGAVLPGVIAHATYNSTLVGMSLLFTTTLKDWKGFTLPGASEVINSIYTSMLISIPFAVLLGVAWWVFRLVTPASAAWKPQPYAAGTMTIPRWLPWIGVVLLAALLTALAMLATMMGNLTEILNNLR